MRPVLIAGTDSWKADGAVDWYCPTSNFARFLESHGVAPLFNSGQPFIWSTDLSGVPFLTAGNHRDWQAGGAALAYYVMFKEGGALPGNETALVAHSHGLQVALYACATFGLKVNTLISVGSPVRKDMMDVARIARPNISHWLHLHSDYSDRWQWLGEMFDGHFGIVREHPLADKNDAVPHVGHSDILRDPVDYHLWLDRGWLTWLQSALTV
jgi:hypothetical protein